MMERLFSGYKAIYSQKGMSKDFFVDDRLKAITFNNIEEFEINLLQILEMTEDAFFNRYKLDDYRFTKEKYTVFQK